VACKSFIERTSWDGDQILIEKRSNGAQGLSSNALDQGSGSSDAWGTVVSVHAHGIDQPVVVRKLYGHLHRAPRQLDGRLPGRHHRQRHRHDQLQRSARLPDALLAREQADRSTGCT
jgi:hypothetical protein